MPRSKRLKAKLAKREEAEKAARDSSIISSGEKTVSGAIEAIAEGLPRQDLLRAAMALSSYGHGKIHDANLQGFYPINLTLDELDRMIAVQGGKSTPQQQRCKICWTLLNSSDIDHQSRGSRILEEMGKHNQREAVIQSQHSPFFIPDAAKPPETVQPSPIEAEIVSVRPITPQEISKELMRSGASESVSRRIGQECASVEFPGGLRLVSEPWEVAGETPSDGNRSAARSDAG